MNMKTSEAGINLIKRFEGCKLTAYNIGGKDVPTIGFGHTSGVKMGMVISQAQANGFLVKDLERFEDNLNIGLARECIDLNQNQFDALVSFSFNCGFGWWTKGMGVKLKAGDYKGAMDRMEKYINPAWARAGLKRRRKAERELFERVVSQARPLHIVGGE